MVEIALVLHNYVTASFKFIETLATLIAAGGGGPEVEVMV